MARASVAGSASIEGTTRTVGVFNAVSGDKTHPAVKRAVIFWCVCVGALLIFHIGGATLE